MKNAEIARILPLYPCPEALEWLKSLPDTDTLEDAWQKCQRGDWMLWLVGKICGPVNTAGHRKMTAAKCRCARLVLHVFEERRKDDPRPRRAIEAAEKYAGGENYAAAPAAKAAAYAAYAATSTDAYAAALAAASAADDAGSTAAYAADDAARQTAREEMLAKCADEVRVVYPTFSAVNV